MNKRTIRISATLWIRLSSLAFGLLGGCCREPEGPDPRPQATTLDRILRTPGCSNAQGFANRMVQYHGGTEFIRFSCTTACTESLAASWNAVPKAEPLTSDRLPQPNPYHFPVPKYWSPPKVPVRSYENGMEFSNDLVLIVADSSGTCFLTLSNHSM